MYNSIHSTFHIFLLELYHKRDDYNTLELIEINNEEE
jgi:hypothetical protein